MRSPFALLFPVSAILAACLLPVTDKADGASCSDDDGCKSHRCFEGFCSGSTCELDDSSSCDDGWKCTHNAPDPVSGFFGSHGSETCKPTCGHCPGNTHCPDEAPPGALCVYGKAPLVLSVITENAIVGRPATIRAVAEDAGPIAECKWNVGDGKPEETTKGGELVRVFADARSYYLRVSCKDDGGRSGYVESTIEIACTPSGETCTAGTCCADESMRCVSGTCRVPAPLAIEIDGPRAVPIDEEVTYAAVRTGGDGVLTTGSWKFDDAFRAESGLTVTHAFDTAGLISVTVNVGTDIHTQGSETIQVNVCQKDGGRCGEGGVTCCAPLTCQGSSSLQTCKP